VKSGIEIPHRRVQLREGVLSKEAVETDFLRQTTHELRTPLNAIIGLCELLDRDPETPLTDRQRDSVHRMQRNAKALLESVNRLLTSLRTNNSRIGQ